MAHPTESEMTTAGRWLEALLASRSLPVAARYGERPLADLLPGRPWQQSSRQVDDQRTQHTLEFRDPGGLVLRWEGIAYKDFPAVEWVASLENTGSADTPILADIQALDTLFPVAEDQRCWVHHHRGSQFRLEDFEPFQTPLVLNVEPDLRLGTTGGRSSDGALPFMNLQTGQAGIILAIGWTGDWAASFHRDPQGVRVAAGMQKTHFKLYPGEKIRTPRILLLFWEGDRWHGQNLLRSFILAYNTPQRDGKPAPLPIVDGAWGKRTTESQLAKMRWLQENRLSIDTLWIDAGWYGDSPFNPKADTWGDAWANQVGSWYPNKVTYPQGLKPIGDACKAAGLGFVLWFEPERVHKDSDIACNHFELTLNSKLPAAQQAADDYLFNLGDPAARQWMANRISALIEEGSVTIYRQDFNMSPNTTTVDFSIGGVFRAMPAARRPFDDDSGCGGPASAWHAAIVTMPDAAPENGRAAAERSLANGALPGPLVRLGRAQAPFFLRGLAANGG